MKRINQRQYKDPSGDIPDRFAPPLSLYFIGVGSHLFIKIGVSEDVEKELKNIQERNPSYPLTLLGCISGCDEKVEKGLFDKLIDFHIGRGWFERSLEMEEGMDYLLEEDLNPSEASPVEEEEERDFSQEAPSVDPSMLNLLHIRSGI